jgi:hypothetical protein
MRRLVVAVAVAVLVSGAAIAWKTTARPRIAVAPTALDFGRIAGRATKIVNVQNLGRAPLGILRVSSSCGCTTAEIETMVLSPGQAARLSITFDAAAHGPELGPAEHAVYVRSDDPATPEVEITVRADVVTERRP